MYFPTWRPSAIADFKIIGFGDTFHYTPCLGKNAPPPLYMYIVPVPVSYSVQIFFNMGLFFTEIWRHDALKMAVVRHFEF